MVRKRKRKTKQKNAKSKHKKSTHEIAMQNLTCGSIWRVKTADEEVNKTGKTVLSGWKRCQVFFFIFSAPCSNSNLPSATRSDLFLSLLSALLNDFILFYLNLFHFLLHAATCFFQSVSAPHRIILFPFALPRATFCFPFTLPRAVILFSFCSAPHNILFSFYSAPCSNFVFLLFCPTQHFVFLLLCPTQHFVFLLFCHAQNTICSPFILSRTAICFPYAPRIHSLIYLCLTC